MSLRIAGKSHEMGKNREKELDSFFANLIYLIAFLRGLNSLNYYGGVL